MSALPRNATYCERKDAGRCVRCGVRPPEAGKVSCRTCLDALGRRPPQVNRPRGAFNVCCQAAGFHRADCSERRAA